MVLIINDDFDDEFNGSRNPDNDFLFYSQQMAHMDYNPGESISTPITYDEEWSNFSLS